MENLEVNIHSQIKTLFSINLAVMLGIYTKSNENVPLNIYKNQLKMN